MSTRTPDVALAEVLGALVHGDDTTDLLATLLHDCADMLPVDAAAILVKDGRGGVELLSATSHRASELELYQAQQRNGPCIAVLETGEPTDEVGADAITGRWNEVGTAIVRAGFLAVHAFPMSWRGHPLGGLNLFSQQPEALQPTSVQLAQSFADVAALALAQAGPLDDDDLARRIRTVLEGRVVVEQAKGVLAQTMGMEMEAAYDELLRRVAGAGSTLSQTARRIVDETARRSV